MIKLQNFKVFIPLALLSFFPTFLYAELLDYTNFSYTQLQPKGNGDIKGSAQLSNSKQTTGDSSDTLRDTGYDLAMTYKASSNFMFGVEYGNEETNKSKLIPDLNSELAPNNYSILKEAQQTENLIGFAKVRVPISSSSLFLSAGLAQFSFKNKKLTKSFKQLSLVSREEINSHATLNQGRFGLAYAQGDGIVGLDFIPSAKSKSEYESYYLPREYSLFARVQVLKNMKIGASVTQNIYDNLNSEATTELRDFNTYKVASEYLWKNKRLNSIFEFSDSPLLEVDGYFDMLAKMYFGVKTSRQLELGANVTYEIEKYTLNQANNYDSKLGMGLEANFIL